MDNTPQQQASPELAVQDPADQERIAQEQAAADLAARMRERELKAILHISNMVGSVLRHEDILRIICETTAEAMEAQACLIFMLDDDGQTLRLTAAHGFDPELIGRATLAMGEGIAGWAAEHKEVVSLANAASDPRFVRMLEGQEDPCKAYLSAPLFIQTELIGVMAAGKAEEYEFTPSEITLFEAICKQVAIVMEKVRLYEDKLHSERLAAIGLSLSEISHYIKNVMQGIKGGSYFVDSGLSRNDLTRAKHGWDILKRANRKITYLVENMLNFSRSSNPSLEIINLEELIIEILNSNEAAAQRRNVVIEPEIEPSLPPVLADYDALYNAVLNLVTNAFDAVESKGGGNVRVALRQDPNSPSQLMLSVADNGPGI
ncbi:MAG: GAF domain-containing protein, partial [Candidatus Sumerlaeota bacterium]|nr:GAF domain-containing protein [Candidatus Sumerlaeota bacterium]